MQDKINRKLTKKIQIGNVIIGDNNPIAIQSMTNTKTSDVDSTVAQILELEKEGCEIIRVAIPYKEDALAIKKIKDQIHIPIVADIHFDYKLAILSIENGADKIRINPGNIGDKDKIKKIIDAANMNNIPIRLGVNAGSLEKNILAKYKHPISDALVESATRWINFFENQNFYDIVLSLKSSDTLTNYYSYMKISERFDYPLHIGVTEAGSEMEGIIKSSAGLGSLLINGVGDTIRISLTGNPLNEVIVAKELLQSLNIRHFTPEIISCPTCGRCEINLENFLKKVKKYIKKINKPLKIAIMGCVVNGPGEAKEADLGIAGGKKHYVIFKNGIIVEKVKEENAVEVFLKYLKEYY